MVSKHLQQAPLVEALFEVKWTTQDLEIDPHYKIFLGRLFERLQHRYPRHEPLAGSVIPDQIAAYTLQHRLRPAPDEWPLVQVGPGILTVNDTEKYRWEDFEKNAQLVFSTLFEAYPKPDELKIIKLCLRYVNAVEFDFARDNVLDFLNQKFNSEVSFPQVLFKDAGIGVKPMRVDCHAGFPCKNPKGEAVIRFSTGYKDDNPVLIWELILETLGEDLPQLPQGFPTWLAAAHQMLRGLFFDLQAAEHERRISSHE